MPRSHSSATCVVSTLLLFGVNTAYGQPQSPPFGITITPIGTYASGIFNQSAAEIVAHDPVSQRLFVVNAQSGFVDVLDIRDPSTPTLLFNVDVGGVVNSVDVHRGVIVAAVEATPKTDPGRAVFFDADGNVLASVIVGALPDMVTFTPDGRRVLVANEGEPSEDYSIDPEGSVSIIDLPRRIQDLSQNNVRTARFTAFDAAAIDPAIRVFGPGASVSQDLEPEYITVSPDSRTAWVALQEANAIAVLDIASGQFTALHALGFKDHLLDGNELDVSDRDGRIKITNWPVFGMYQPDAIANMEYHGRNYILTANEGDSRDWPGYSEEVRFGALEPSICPDSPRLLEFLATNTMGIATLEELRANEAMGRLTVTRATGLREDGGCYRDIYAYGARSFSIWNEDFDLVWDSGSELERITAARFPDHFNSNHNENSFETRSDDKGPEPEAVTVAKLWGSTYAFIGLERIGGVMIYDVTNPYSPYFVDYVNNRDFSQTPGTPQSGDQGAEDVLVIESANSPIPGVPLLVVANEVSGTTTVFRIDRVRKAGN